MKKTVVVCDDQPRFIEEFIRRHGSYYNIIPVSDMRYLPEKLIEMETLPDIVLLDLYHPRDDDDDFEQRRREAEAALAAFDDQIEKTKIAVNRTWEPFGIELLRSLRSKYSPQELPIAIYSQKGIFLLEDKELLEVEQLNAHWLLKKKLSAQTEAVRIERIISYWKSIRNTETSKRVFVVHGHDSLSLTQLTEMLRDELKLEPVILSNEPALGRTLVESLETIFSNIAFGFVLLTPDDLVHSNDHEYYQARPNVLIETGWLYGKLGRNKVCLLCKEGTVLPSDLAGLKYIPYHNDVKEAFLMIKKEVDGLVV